MGSRISNKKLQQPVCEFVFCFVLPYTFEICEVFASNHVILQRNDSN